MECSIDWPLEADRLVRFHQSCGEAGGRSVAGEVGSRRSSPVGWMAARVGIQQEYRRFDRGQQGMKVQTVVPGQTVGWAERKVNCSVA